jgi:hypothetical protein
MTGLEQRLARATRAVEWLEAYRLAERCLQWALATDKLAPHEVPALRGELKAVAPFTSYVGGRWQPPEITVDSDAMASMAAAVDAWEAEQGITR